MLVCAAAAAAGDDCLRLDGDVSPARYNYAWKQFFPTRFEFSQAGRGALQLRFTDGLCPIVMVFDDRAADGLARNLQAVVSAPGTGTDPGGADLTFDGWFRLGPRWYRTGAARGRARLVLDPEASPATPYRLEFTRLVSSRSPFLTYQPGDLYFTRDLLMTLGHLAAGDAESAPLLATAALGGDRACGPADLPADLHVP